MTTLFWARYLFLFLLLLAVALFVLVHYYEKR